MPKPHPATHTGVEKPRTDAADVQFSTKNPRNDLIDQISRTTEHDLLLGEATDDPTLTPESVAEDPAPEQEEKPAQGEPEKETPEQTEPEPLAAKPEPEAESADDYIETATYGKKKVRVKVDGEDRVVTFDELLRDAQKKGAADRRLEEATRLLNEAKEIRSKPQPSSREDDAPQYQQPPPLDEGVAAMVSAIRTGTDEEATYAAQQWQEELRKRSTVPDGDMRAYVNDAIDFRSSADWCKTEYSDLFADATLAAMFADKDERQVRASDKRPYRERYQEIGEGLRAWRNSLTKAQPAPTATLEAKRERKAAVTIPTATGVKDTPPPVEDETEDNVADVIANIAKKRGQNLRI